MFEVVLNSLFYIILLIFHWVFRKHIDCGFLLIALYATISVVGVILYISDPTYWHLQLWPFVYIYVIFLLCARPYLQINNENLYCKLKVNSFFMLKLLSNIYINFAVYFCLFTMKTVVFNLLSGDWLTFRTSLYNKELEIYTNFLEGVALFFVVYVHKVAVVIVFYFLTLKEQRIRALILLLWILLSQFSFTIITASRGTLVDLFSLFIVCYLVFNKGIASELKKKIMIYAVICLSIAVIYSMSVTASRFGNEDTSNSLLFYFGHSFMRFNYGIADSIQRYAGGQYFFRKFYDILGIRYTTLQNLGTHVETHFFTFVGSLYLDFGPIGTFLIALFISLVICKIISKRTLNLAHIYIYVYFLHYLLRGVFVIGNSNSIEWIVLLFIYLILNGKFKHYA